MIWTWLAHRAGVLPLIDRVAALEADLADAKTTIGALQERVAAAEAHGAAGAGGRERLDRQVRILTRAVRAGTNRVRQLQAKSLDQPVPDARIEKELERLNAAILIVGSRVEAEAEQSRSSTVGLLRKIDAIRPRETTDRAG